MQDKFGGYYFGGSIFVIFWMLVSTILKLFGFNFYWLWIFIPGIIFVILSCITGLIILLPALKKDNKNDK